MEKIGISVIIFLFSNISFFFSAFIYQVHVRSFHIFVNNMTFSVTDSYKSWKKRWFVLDYNGRTVKYYETSEVR